MVKMPGSIKHFVEQLLPAHIMSLAIDKLYAQGYEIRMDTRGYLNNYLVKVLSQNQMQARSIALRTDAVADDIMRPVHFDDAQMVLLSSSFLMLKLVEEKLYLDADNQAVLSALMIVADADADENPEWHKLVPAAREKAAKMLDECLRQGLYLHTVVPS